MRGTEHLRCIFQQKRQFRAAAPDRSGESIANSDEEIRRGDIVIKDDEFHPGAGDLEIDIRSGCVMDDQQIRGTAPHR